MDWGCISEPALEKEKNPDCHDAFLGVGVNILNADYIKHSTAGLLSGAPARIREITEERTVSSGSELWSITLAGSSRRGRLVPAIFWEFVLFFLFFLCFVGQSKHANFKSLIVNSYETKVDIPLVPQGTKPHGGEDRYISCITQLDRNFKKCCFCSWCTVSTNYTVHVMDISWVGFEFPNKNPYLT